MSHIPKIGRRRANVRLGIGVLYVILILGGLTTVYPFLLMLSTATKSQTDYARLEIVPAYLTNGTVLFTKYVEDRYANNLDDVNAAYGITAAKIADLRPKPTNDSTTLLQNWATFMPTLPLTYSKAAFGEHDNAPSLLLLRYRAHLREVFHDDIAALNKAWTEENVGFDNVAPPFERTARREWIPNTVSPKVADWLKFRATLPPQFTLVTLVDPLYQSFLRQEVYEDKLADLNRVWGTSYAQWADISLPQTPTGNMAQQLDWEKFVRTKYPLRMLTVDPSALPAWRAFLRTRKRANATVAVLPETVPVGGDTLTDWMEFVARAAPVSALRADSPENRWRVALARKYKAIAGANAAFGRDWHTFDDAQPPQMLADVSYVQAHRGELRGDFATRNFRAVTGYILLHGRAVWNTVAYCLLAILAAVIVNPLCAYALSRYPLPYAYRVLLFLLATMAFPAEVAMIPNFLLLRDLGMLNTFWALVLPGLASGFSIFLLKGFFDSLPKELYEAGLLDGATELTMFRRITIPLSLPIFSVIALQTFAASYGAFLFAMVVCQNPNMWTLMVWLYNLQDTAPQYVIMAALTLSALPTLIVFLFAQKVILRGIILPSFK